jgi:hypothetical protein
MPRHCNSLFLKQAGVDNDFIRLPISAFTEIPTI